MTQKCYICDSEDNLKSHGITSEKNIDLCEKCHKEFKSADLSTINQVRRAYRERKFGSKSIKSFRSPRGNLVEWSKTYKEFREWVKIPGGLKNYLYTGAIPK